MKKYCLICKYKTLVLPSDHDKCSGCGSVYQKRVKKKETLGMDSFYE